MPSFWGMVEKAYEQSFSHRLDHISLQQLRNTNTYRLKGSQILSHSCDILASSDQLSAQLSAAFEWLCIVSAVSVLAGLLALLLIVLEWTRPGLLSPLRPICDLRVLNHFIQEARDAEIAMVREKYVHAFRWRSRWSFLLAHCGPGITHMKIFYVPFDKSTLNALTLLLLCFLRSLVQKDVACQSLSLFPSPQ